MMDEEIVLENVPCEDCGAAQSIKDLGLCPKCMAAMAMIFDESLSDA